MKKIFLNLIVFFVFLMLYSMTVFSQDYYIFGRSDILDLSSDLSSDVYPEYYSRSTDLNIEEMKRPEQNFIVIPKPGRSVSFIGTRKGKNYLLGTVFISGLGLIKIKVDLDNKEVLNFEKRSFFDMMKIIKKGDRYLLSQLSITIPLYLLHNFIY